MSSQESLSQFPYKNKVVNTSEVDVAGLKPYLNENTTFLKTCLKILTDKSFENDTFMEILDELEVKCTTLSEKSGDFLFFKKIFL